MTLSNINKDIPVDESTSVISIQQPISSHLNHDLIFPTASTSSTTSLSRSQSSFTPTSLHISKKQKKSHSRSSPDITSFPRAFFLDQKLSLYYGTYPTPLELTLSKFGRPSTTHSFTSEATLDHVIVHLLRTQILSHLDVLSIRKVHPLYNHLHQSLLRCRHIDFRSLSEINTSYATQTTINKSRAIKFLAALLHYNFDVPSIIRFCGNNYVNAHINPTTLRHSLTGIVPKHIIDYVSRSLITGAPTQMNGHTSSKNFWTSLRYGNHVSITSRKELVEKSLNKEERNNYTLPFPSWTARFIPNLHVSPSGIIIKPGKKDRIIFDASFHVNHSSFAPNDWTHASDEPPIYYGTALLRHLHRIWNLRITYPDDVIYLWDDDVAGAFRLIKYNPHVATAFASIINLRLWIPVGQVFGGNTSAQNFEGVARAREILSEHLSHPSFSSLIQKHHKILDLIQYSHPKKDTLFVKAAPCSINKGVLDDTGQETNTPHNMFVDDNHIAATKSNIKLAQAASIEGLFRILGFPDTQLRRTPLSDDKYYREKCGPTKIQLGYVIDSCSMTVSFADERFIKILSSLSNFHSKRKMYTLREAATLAGHLEFFASMTPWLRFLTVALKKSILLALQNNSKKTTQDRKNSQFITDSKLLSHDFETIRRKNFAVSKILQKTWHSRQKYRVSSSLRKELKLLQFIFKNRSTYKFASPIAHLIKKDFDFHALGDACLEGAGGFSSDLKFWWYISWPQPILHKTLKAFVPTYKTLSGDFISINLLEYVTIIISLAASILKIQQKTSSLRHPNPTLSIQSDNTTAVAWTRKAASSTQAGKSLAFILTSLLTQNQHVGLSSTHIAGKDNDVADEISRTPSLANPSSQFTSISILKQKHPQLKDSLRFLPSPEFLCAIWDALLLKPVHPLIKIASYGHWQADITSG